MKWFWGGLLIGSLVLNGVLAYVAKDFYQQVQLIRINPLQLEAYPNNHIAKSTKPRIVLFGDSRALSWPAPALENVEFINRGIGGQTSSQLRLRFAEHVTPLQADLVIMQLCVNDLKVIARQPQRRDTIVQQCKDNLQSIVQAARQAGSDVLLTTVFPASKATWLHWVLWSEAVDSAVDDVNQYIKSLAGNGVYVLDTYSVLQGAPHATQPEYSRDLLHLNAAGYAALNQALIQWLKQYVVAK